MQSYSLIRSIHLPFSPFCTIFPPENQISDLLGALLSDIFQIKLPIMKQLPLLLLLLLLRPLGLGAQVCTEPQSSIDLHGNNIQARILNGGDLFTNHTEGRFIPNPDINGEGPSTFFTAGLWLGGVDAAGNLKLDATTYRGNGHVDFFAGPLSPDGQTDASTCSNWDRHFLVRGQDVQAFLAALPTLANDPVEAQAQFPDIMGWPAKGNPFFQSVWGFDLPFTNTALAPFFDADENGVYNPLQGDYPVVALRNKPLFVPDQMVWCVFNDQGAGALHTASNGDDFPVEVQLTAWAFDDSLLNNTVFTSHKLIFRTTEQLDSCFIGIWADFDIGCYADDYIGTAPALNAMYAFNLDAVDGLVGNSCDGIPVFENIPPVQSITFLNTSMDKAIINSPNAPFSQNTPVSYYNLLNGHWSDGTPLTAGGSGYLSGNTPADLIFPDAPNDPNGWSMCTAKIAFGDRQGVASHRIGRILPGQVEEFTLAWTVHPNPELPCGLGNTFETISEIQNTYDQNFNGGVLEAPHLQLPPTAVTLQPNPVATSVKIGYENLNVQEIRCFDASGRMIRTLYNLPKTTCDLDVSGWQSGVYTLQLLTSGGIATKQLVVLR